MCGVVSQNLPEIQGDIALPRDVRRKGGGKGGRCRCRCGRIVAVAIAKLSPWLSSRRRRRARG